MLQVTADTRYKLYVNQQLVHFGPVKGDQHLWFYDELDIGPFLRAGENEVAVVVLRYFYSKRYAPAFPRLPTGGLKISPLDPDGSGQALIGTWECAIDPSKILRVDEAEDDFLHIYEKSTEDRGGWEWCLAEPLEFSVSTGNSVPWTLSQRLIPPLTGRLVGFRAVHNAQSRALEVDEFQKLLRRQVLRMPAGSSHQVDLEAPEHVTAFLRLRFCRPAAAGAKLVILYSESYEDKPTMIPYLRNKQHRQDTSKSLYGPKDIYVLEGPRAPGSPCYAPVEEEVIAPFHWRTFRFIRLHIETGCAELDLLSIDVETANYPLEVRATMQCSKKGDDQLWKTSLRTLKNCMHDCYEDCPFYEQLQYAMDTRSSILFTYYSSGDDRLARQAIIQIHNSFHLPLGLTRSRAPSHRSQVIPPFSLYWIFMVEDHLYYFNDCSFTKRFLAVIDAILFYFDARIDPNLGLVRSEQGPGIWNFVDWAEDWRPFGVPPAVERSSVSTYINQLYACALQTAATIYGALERRSAADDYLARARAVVEAVRTHCFDGSFYTDSLASGPSPEPAKNDYSQHCQIWAVLCGAVSPQEGQSLLRQCLSPDAKFTPTSVSMAFYTLRALAKTGGDVYDKHFEGFWDPWRDQLRLGVTTWEEDSVSQRSDCHAWGSAPIYEFMAEVAGVRPLGPGWSAVAFQPRVGLYNVFEATVPMGASGGGVMGLARVKWAPEGEVGGKVVSLKFEMRKYKAFPVYVTLPGQAPRLMDSAGSLTFIV